jgi:hypothetical protein
MCNEMRLLPDNLDTYNSDVFASLIWKSIGLDRLVVVNVDTGLSS